MNFNDIEILGSNYKLASRSHSWAVGPMLGTIGHWILGSSFRFEGKAGGALVYTRYNKISQSQVVHNNDPLADATAILYSSSALRDLNVLRPMVDFGVGLGWGSYLNCQNYYFDLSARYDFNLLWDQNVMATFVSQMNNLVGASGNLYMHGLTLSARFDF